MEPCPFCELDRPILVATPLALAFADAFPATPGHALVVPRRHVASYFDCTDVEKAALWTLVDQVCARLQGRAPDGYNVGFNAGAAAGQTVFHAHVHVIPRYRGDVDEPRGGIRCAVLGRPPGA